MSTQEQQAQIAVMEANDAWVVQTAERMLTTVDVDGIAGDPSEQSLAVMVSTAALSVAFSALRGQFGPDARVKEMLVGMVGELNYDDREASAQ